MSEGSRMKATVVSLTKKKGTSWGMADLSIVCDYISFLYSHSVTFGPTICCDPTSVFLFWLATRAGRAMTEGRTAVGARKATLAKGRRMREFMVGYLRSAGQRAAVGYQLAAWNLRTGD